MINHLKKILTGYYTENKKINGARFTFHYSDKPVFFDPLEMIREFKKRSSNYYTNRLELQIPFSESFTHFISSKVQDQPNVICVCITNGNELKVSRFSLKDGLYPLSFYRFELNGVLSGSFLKKYDYGSQIQKTALDFSALNNSTIVLKDESWLWENNLGDQVFLEKFGHTQTWSFAKTILASF
jgi:hypothetical protein